MTPVTLALAVTLLALPHALPLATGYVLHDGVAAGGDGAAGADAVEDLMPTETEWLEAVAGMAVYETGDTEFSMNVARLLLKQARDLVTAERIDTVTAEALAEEIAAAYRRWGNGHGEEKSPLQVFLLILRRHIGKRIDGGEQP